MPVILSLSLPGEAATAALAEALAPLLKAGDTLLLEGPLGAGKTSFARALIRALAGPETEVPSPSFNLVLTYETSAGTVWHFDLYRVADPRELDELGLDEAMSDGITLIEWPDRLGKAAPVSALTCRLAADSASPAIRRAELLGDDRWAQRLSRLTVPDHV